MEDNLKIKKQGSSQSFIQQQSRLTQIIKGSKNLGNMENTSAEYMADPGFMQTYLIEKRQTMNYVPEQYESHQTIDKETMGQHRRSNANLGTLENENSMMHGYSTDVFNENNATF